MSSKKRLIIHISILIAALISSSFGSSFIGEGSTLLAFGASPTVEEYVREYFDEVPILAEIAGCESRFRHFDKNGDVIRGEQNELDVGVMQINEYYHGDTAQKFGHNIYTLNGNLKYALNLFEREGTAPWLSSSRCWGRENHIAKK